MSHRWIGLMASFCLVAVSPRPAAALEVTPHVGALIPARALVGGDVWARMAGHSVLGLSLGTSVSDRLGLELSLAAGSGTMEYFARELKSTVLLADVRGRWAIRGNEDASLGLVVGGGYTDFDVGYFESLEDVGLASFVGRLTGIAGLDVRGRLSDRVHLTVSALDRIHDQGASHYSWREAPEKLQHDVMFTAGLRFPLD
jgi:hypothetical protein